MRSSANRDHKQASVFSFKQFLVDQENCTMKINTDGVLVGALAGSSDPQHILDIGTGTGVIALMLSQRFLSAKVEAIEIDPGSCETASGNFKTSSFSERMAIFPGSFTNFFEQYPDKKYDLIVSNPPFFVDSLKSDSKSKEVARHTDPSFFADLAFYIPAHLSDKGTFWVILPVNTSELFRNMMKDTSLKLTQVVSIRSFADSKPHRELLAFSKGNAHVHSENFIIYRDKKEYSSQFKDALQDFFTIF